MNTLDTVLLSMSSKESQEKINELGNSVKDKLENLNLDNLLCNGVDDICNVIIHISKLFKDKEQKEAGTPWAGSSQGSNPNRE